MSASTLPDFEGLEVIRAAMKITNAGDGLSDALSVSPVAFHVGDEVYVVLKGVVDQVNHRPAPKQADVLQRVHTLATTEITIVDEKAVGKMLADATERVRRAKEKAAGILSLDGAATDRDHEAGNHAGALVEGCPKCQREAELEAAGE